MESDMGLLTDFAVKAESTENPQWWKDGIACLVAVVAKDIESLLEKGIPADAPPFLQAAMPIFHDRAKRARNGEDVAMESVMQALEMIGFQIGQAEAAKMQAAQAPPASGLDANSPGVFVGCGNPECDCSIVREIAEVPSTTVLNTDGKVILDNGHPQVVAGIDPQVAEELGRALIDAADRVRSGLH